MLSNSFKFFRVFKGCFDKLGSNFDDVSKIGYSRPSYKTGILKYDVIIYVCHVTS